jgi:hypothetical protein
MPLVIAGNSSGSTTVQATDAVTAVITLPSATDTLVGKITPSFTTTIGVGNATPSTSGAGITFPATQSASTDANTLDDYEEGTWTASYGGQTNTGTYTKIGRVVSIEVILNKAATFSGMTGLPFSGAGVTPASKSRGNGSDTNINTFSMGVAGTGLDFYTNTGAAQTIITTGTVRIDIQCTYQI